MMTMPEQIIMRAVALLRPGLLAARVSQTCWA
jgi:hypothetical protein